MSRENYKRNRDLLLHEDDYQQSMCLQGQNLRGCLTLQAKKGSAMHFAGQRTGPGTI